VFRQSGREAKVLKECFGDSLKHMIAVTDRHSAYFAIDFLNNQVCLAHLLRNLEYLNDMGREQTWAKQVQQNLDHLRKEFNQLKNGLVKCRDYLFNFLDDPDIPADNNVSERGIRKLRYRKDSLSSYRGIPRMLKSVSIYSTRS
jgi:hypothetical protein